MAESPRLSVEIGEVVVAHIEMRRWNDLRCRYTPDAFERWPDNTPVLSCSLPLGPGPLQATGFCRGLLAEGRALDAMASLAGVATNDTFGLLARYGRDVAGAITLIDPRRETPARTPGFVSYSDDDLDTAVSSLDDNPLGLEDDSELSLAGIQNKLLLVRDGDRWARPTGGFPSTHILKAGDPRFPGLIEAEQACLALGRAAGLDAANTRLGQIGTHTCLIVERFDRSHSAEPATRIHQEDACQALGVDTSDARGRAKYERAGGPSLKDIAAVLDRFATDALTEMERLLAATAFAVVVGNADAHGKNISLLHEPLGTTRLAPLYDVVPTVLWPALRSELAMTIGDANDVRAVTRADLIVEATSWGLPVARANAVIDELCERARVALDDVDHEALAEYARAAVDRLEAER